VASAIDLLTYFKELTEKPPRALVAGALKERGQTGLTGNK
jgi:hypothetical protein